MKSLLGQGYESDEDNSHELKNKIAFDICGEDKQEILILENDLTQRNLNLPVTASLIAKNTKNNPTTVVTYGNKRHKMTREEEHHNSLKTAMINPAIFDENFHNIKEINRTAERERNLVEASAFPPPPSLEILKKPTLPHVIEIKGPSTYETDNKFVNYSNVGEFNAEGPWAPEVKEVIIEKEEEEKVILSADQQKYLIELEEKRQKVIETQELVGEGLGVEYLSKEILKTNTSTKYYGKARIDFMGRTWIEPPSDQARLLHSKNLKISGNLTENKERCFLPKKKIHSFKGHKRGIQNIRFYPVTGHLMLSSGLDGLVKIWDMGRENYSLKRDINGHKTAIKFIDLIQTGEKYLSTAFDGKLLIWDIETGQSSHGFRCKDEAIYFQAKFVPQDPNIIIGACSNHKLIQLDLREKKGVIEYTHHQGPVNTITFYDNNQKFASTSDDKQMLLWEYGLPVPTQQLAGAGMSMSTMKLHPEGEFLAGQCLDNSIVIFAGDSNRVHRQRALRGHTVKGHAMELDFSPDGQFVISGDAEGKLFGYDWKSGNVYSNFIAHESGPCVALAWHPLEQSKVVTGGWDGSIHYWD